MHARKPKHKAIQQQGTNTHTHIQTYIPGSEMNVGSGYFAPKTNVIAFEIGLTRVLKGLRVGSVFEKWVQTSFFIKSH